MLVNTLGDNIARILKEKNMTLSELAEKGNLPKVHLVKYINGEKVPRGAMLCKIAETLDTTVETLLGEKLESLDYTLKEYSLRNYTKIEYETNIKKAIAENGLYNVVDDICYEIIEDTEGLSFFKRRDIQECLFRILDAIKLNDGGKNV